MRQVYLLAFKVPSWDFESDQPAAFGLIESLFYDPATEARTP
jgi:hypothetical protein